MKYKRILLKLSGEALAGNNKYGIDTNTLTEFAEQIKEISDLGVEIGIVIGGGNIFRGLKGADRGFDRVKGDYMGMLATTINGLAIESAMESIGKKSHVLSSTFMEPYAERYMKPRALQYLEKKEIVIFTGGTSNPYFTTDSAAALRAIEIEADILLKGTRVDGVYSADPEKYPDALRFDKITFDEVIDKDLKVMDLTAFALCQQNKMPIIVFDMNKKGNLKKIIEGENIGTIVY